MSPLFGSTDVCNVYIFWFCSLWQTYYAIYCFYILWTQRWVLEMYTNANIGSVFALLVFFCVHFRSNRQDLNDVHSCSFEKKLFDSSEVCFRTCGQNTFVRLGFNYIDYITFIHQFPSKRSAPVWRIVKISVRFKPTAFVFVRFVIFIFFWKKSFFFQNYVTFLFGQEIITHPIICMFIFYRNRSTNPTNERTNERKLVYSFNGYACKMTSAHYFL